MIKAKDIKDFVNSTRKFEIINTNEQLNEVANILKSEFIGIDNQIDQLINAVKPWLFFKDSLEKPLVINLVGLTGCGKTALVDRLLVLLGLEFHAHTVNGSDLNDEKALNFLLYDQNKNIDHPVIILDEFQNYKAKDKDGEIDTYNSGLWLFMDTGTMKFDGRIESYDTNTGVSAAIRVLRAILYFKNRTYKNLSFSLTSEEYKRLEDVHNYVEDSIDISKSVLADIGDSKIYADIADEIILDLLGVCDLKSNPNNPKSAIYTFKPEFIDEIKNIMRLYGLDAITDINMLHEDMRNMSIGDITDFLITIRADLLNGSKKPKINYKRSLIFVLLNLDEAYHGMHSDFNADISADEFSKMSQKITIVEIKEALMERYRAEHVSRLGNTFIIYPSLDSKAYKTIIGNILNNYSNYIQKTYGITLKYHPSIHTIIYNENVFPTLGVRPLQTGINDLIKSNFANTLLYKNANNIACDTIEYSYKHRKITARFYKNNNLVDSTEHRVNLRLESLRNNKGNDQQALVAVHESGHAVAQIVLFNKLPLQVLSVTTDPDALGLTVDAFDDDKILNKKIIRNRISVMLAGMAAENIVFGEDAITTGSSSDLESATELMMSSYRKWGLMGSLGTTTLGGEDDGLIKEYHNDDYQDRGNAKITEIMQDTVQLLENYKPLLLQMSKHLANNTSISQSKLKKIIQKYSDIDVKSLIGINEKPNYGYKDKLNKLIANL
jgi:cell division protease FtsH